MKRQKNNGYEELFFSKVDLAREKIKGYPEVIFCEGKTTDQIIRIMRVMAENKQDILATRANKKTASRIKKEFPHIKYHELARVFTFVTKKNKKLTRTSGRRSILVISAGTADLPVAEEAAITAEFMGNRVERLYDVGVAGLHRLLKHVKKLRTADALIVVAGMEGALPSVVAGLTNKPVIAVPTSIGYGSNFEGLSALLTMLNSCSPGIAVMNIDNGFGAGYFASIDR